MKKQSFKPKNLCFWLLALGFMLTAGMKCKKDNNLDKDGLPKATQTGAGVFACKINGENWTSSKKSRDMGGGITSDAFTVFGTTGTNDGIDYFGSMEIHIKNPGSSKTFRLNGLDERFALYVTHKNCFDVTGGYGVGQSKSTDGEVVFTRIDTEKKIISGTFWCDIPTDKCGVLKVTDGRFDIRYY